MRLTDCIACRHGQHDGHTEIVQAAPEGVLGGVECHCTGDCAERNLPHEAAEGEAVKGLEAAAEALYESHAGRPGDPPWERADENVRGCYLRDAEIAARGLFDSLLGDIPEESITATRDWLSRYAIWSVTNAADATFEERKAAQIGHTVQAISAFLESLRSSLDGS